MISVIICSIDETKFAAVSANYKSLLADEPHEIIRISDAKGLCEGYNRGLDLAQGDLLIFSHDDIEILAPDFTTRLKKHLQSFDVIGMAGTDLFCGPFWLSAGHPHIFGQAAHFNKQQNCFDVVIYATPSRVVANIQALDGFFLAFRRSAISQLRWDEKTFTGFHYYDIDTVFRAHLAGLRVGVACDLPLIHYSGGKLDDNWKIAARAFYEKHLPRLPKMNPQQYSLAGARVAAKQEILAVMSPLYWRD